MAIRTDIIHSAPSYAKKFTPWKPASSPTVNEIELKQFIKPQLLSDFSRDLSLKDVLNVAVTPVFTEGFTSGSVSTGDVISDVSWLFRSLMVEGTAAEWMGLTTGECIIRGPITAMKAWEAFQAARAVGDRSGMVGAGMDLASRVNQAAGGAFYLVYRGLMAVADWKNVNTAYNATTLLGKAAFWVGTIGNIFFTLLFAAMTLWGGWAIWENAWFRAELEGCKDNKELSDLLKKKVIADPHSKFVKHTTPEAIKKFRNKCLEGALDAITELFCHQAEKGGVSHSRAEMKEFVKEVFDKLGKDRNNEGLPIQILRLLNLTSEEIHAWQTEANGGKLSLLEAMGFRLEEMKRGRRKVSKFSRVVGSAAPKVQKALQRGLLERLESKDYTIARAANDEVSNLKGRINWENTKNLVIVSLVFFSGVVGLASSVIGFFPVLGVGLMAALITTSVLLCLGLSGADIYFMLEGLKGGGAPGKYDKLYIALMAFVWIPVILALSIGMTFGCGLPLIPLIFVGIFSLIGWGSCAVAWDQLNYKEQRWKWENPTLEWILEMGQSLLQENQALDKKTKTMLKKLSEADKKAVRERYFRMSASPELKFKDQALAELDKTSHFSRAYFNAYQKAELAPGSKQYKQFLSGVKETRNYYWEEWNKASAKEGKEAALKTALQMEAVYTQAKNNRKITTSNSQILSRLYADLWYAAKRGDSKQDLIKVIRAVHNDRPNVAVPIPKQPSFIDSALGYFKTLKPNAA